MDVSAAVIEISSAERKALQFIAYSRRDVVNTLLTFPELQNNKQQATQIAQVVWDMQGKVETKQPSIRAKFVETMTRSRGTAGRAKPASSVSQPEATAVVDIAVPDAGAKAESPALEPVTTPLFTA